MTKKQRIAMLLEAIQMAKDNVAWWEERLERAKNSK